MPTDPKDVLHRYLQEARDALLWKLDGVSEYDARRPLTPTGTNLLGLVKHVSLCEADYLGMVFGRPLPDRPAWMDSDEPNADMWARPDESREELVGLYRRVWAHADATIAALGLDAVGEVPWWSEAARHAPLHRILVHLVAETHRHAGHADIVRELIDGSAGLRVDADNLPSHDAPWWREYRAQVEQAAREAADAEGGGS
ncbi:DinB family protein [Georgenia faecalis]|uniref:DinB family protein n=1 Tax=Georgenia faecalis TaxID=2483799 RepID=UPI000FD9B576|nr:DinB family protein [Georgenia faecalis]